MGPTSHLLARGGDMRIRTAAKRSCINCHFLQRRDWLENGQEFHTHWQDHEIENRKLDEVGNLARVPICSREVWDGGIDTSLSEDSKRLKGVVERNRKDTCFFIKRDRSMSNDAAYLLWERWNENRAIKKSYMFTLIALFITGIGMLINSILGILGLENSKRDILWGWLKLLFDWARGIII